MLDEEGNEVTTLQDDPGSMAFKLARAEEAPKSPEEIEAARQADEVAEAERVAVEAAEAERLAAEAGETPEEKAAREEREAQAAKEAAEAEVKKPKYASIEEAEKGAREAAAKMTEATQAAAREKEAREAAEKELETFRTAEAERQAAAAEAERAAKVAGAQPEIEAKYAEAIKKIGAIPLGTDPETGAVVYPDDYDAQVAKAWAGTALNPEEIIEEAARRAEQRMADKQAATQAAGAEKTKADEAAATRAEAEQIAASKFGLDMTPGSADARVFDTFVNELAYDQEHEVRKLPFEEQVKWASEGVRKVLGKKIEMTDAERAAARQHQDRQAILERGVTRTIPDEKPRQRSMQEILAAQSH
jgi:hypothetical protein